MTLQYDPENNVHLRDAEHARNLYTQNNLSFAPKTKFLYHVVFMLKDEAAKNAAPNTQNHIKELGVLAKSVDLPNYRVSTETRQQYNRKKNVQTRIDYDECRFVFHDDNASTTNSLLKEYYNFYYRDGRHSAVDYGTRDKFKEPNKKFGLDNGMKDAFFSHIKIYQLAQRKWWSYTLVNPLVTSFGHDTLDNADGAGVMENNMSIAYESVIYDQGNISETLPTNFTDDETGYDKKSSPLINGSVGYTPKNDAQANYGATTTTFVSNPTSGNFFDNLFGDVLRSNSLFSPTQAVGRYATTTPTSILPSTRILSELTNNPSYVASLASTSVLLGIVSGDSPQQAIQDTVVDLATRDPNSSSDTFKLAQLATKIIAGK